MNSAARFRSWVVALSALAFGLPAFTSAGGELQMQSNLVREDFDNGSNWLTPNAWNAIPRFQTDATDDEIGRAHV